MGFIQTALERYLTGPVTRESRRAQHTEPHPHLHPSIRSSRTDARVDNAVELSTLSSRGGECNNPRRGLRSGWESRLMDDLSHSEASDGAVGGRMSYELLHQNMHTRM